MQIIQKKELETVAGQIRKTIDRIISEKSRGNSVIASSIRTKMILKGISVDKFNMNSPDDPEILKKLQLVATEYGIRI